jgi:hypothetical protein
VAESLTQKFARPKLSAAADRFGTHYRRSALAARTALDAPQPTFPRGYEANEEGGQIQSDVVTPIVRIFGFTTKTPSSQSIDPHHVVSASPLYTSVVILPRGLSSMVTEYLTNRLAGG